MLNCVLIFLDISGGELAVIALVALLVLGPQKMGDFARKAGKMMNEVKRVSSDFTNQFNDETGSIQKEVRGIRDSIKDVTGNIKDEFNQQKKDVENKLDIDKQQDISAPSNVAYDLSKDPSEKESHVENVIKEIPSEHSEKQPVSIDEQAINNPTSNQENTTNP